MNTTDRQADEASFQEGRCIVLGRKELESVSLGKSGGERKESSQEGSNTEA